MTFERENVGVDLFDRILEYYKKNYFVLGISFIFYATGYALKFSRIMSLHELFSIFSLKIQLYISKHFRLALVNMQWKPKYRCVTSICKFFHVPFSLSFAGYKYRLYVAKDPKTMQYFERKVQGNTYT